MPPLVINRANKYIEILKKICLSTFFDFDFSLIIKILNILGSKSKYLLALVALVIKNFEVSSNFKNRPKTIALHDINETSYTLDKKIKETLVRGSVLEKR